MEIAFPDYQNCGLNLTSSILRYFGTPCDHPTLPFLEEKLEGKSYRNVVLMLFDGMGMDALQNHLTKDAFLRAHVAHVLSAVFPSTTTAATTAIECAKSPAEHGWLGWTLYFQEIDQAVDIFTNRVQGTGERAAEDSIVRRYMPIRDVFAQMKGDVRAACISPFGDPRCKTLGEVFQNTERLAAEPGRHFLYAYWGDPDHTMHDKGVCAPEVGDRIREIDARVEALCAALPEDTLVLVTADHGLIDANHLFVSDSPELMDMLVRPPTVEPRAAAFYVKEECLGAFPAAFRRAFGQNFILLTREEFLRSGLLGPGKQNKKLPEIVGDYMAIATDHDCIDNSPECTLLKGVHAGLTTTEMRVPLIVAKD